MIDKKLEPDVATAAVRHGRDLQRVNARLHDLIDTLRSSRERLAASRAATPAEVQPRSTPAPPAWPNTEPAGVVVLERRRLENDLALAREQLQRAAAEGETLRQQLAELELDHRRVCDDFVEAGEQANELVQLHATLQQIHAASGPEELLKVLQEVVINVVGCEELAIFDLRDGVLNLARAVGVDAAALRRIPLGEGVIGRVAQTGRLYVAGRDGPVEDQRLTACLPLKAGGGVVGVIAIFRLLGHKPGLGPADQALFDLLIPHAGQALYLLRTAERLA